MRLQLACLVCASALAFTATVLAGKIPVVNEGGIRDAWALPAGVALPVPVYPTVYRERRAETCVAIGYLLNADGSTSDFALLKGWSAGEPSDGRDAYWGAFAQAASEALARWRFVPRPEAGPPAPVYTVATFLFAPADAVALRGRCAIPNLERHLAALRTDGKARRKMQQGDIFDRLDIGGSRASAGEWRPNVGSSRPPPQHPAPGEPGIP